MENINIQIIIILTSGTSLIMGFFMLLLRNDAEKMKAIYCWATGSIIIGMGMLFKLIPPTHGFLSSVVPPLSVTIGLYSYLAGIWSFKEKRINKWVILGIPSFDIIQSIFLFQLFPSNNSHIVLHSLCIIVYCLIAIYEMVRIRPDQKYLKTIFRLNAFVFMIFLGISVLIFTIIIRPDYNPLVINKSVIAIYILSNFVMTALTFGFISAVNLELHTNLENQIKSQTKFFAIIAHDLRGPLGNIMNFLKLINSEPDLIEEERQKFFKMIESLSKSTFHLLQNLLEWATSSKSIAQFESEVIDLNQMIEKNIDFFDNLTMLKSIRLKFIEGKESYIHGNANMVEGIIRNLVSNAIKFTPDGGEITILVQYVSNRVYVIFSDTGMGIEAEKLSNLFTFERSKSSKGTNGETGSGLGLVLCKEFTELNNGLLHIESEVGVGTKVTVDFPAI